MVTNPCRSCDCEIDQPLSRYCSKCHPMALRSGYQEIDETTQVDWYLFSNMETAKHYVCMWLEHRSLGPGGSYSDRPAFRARRNGQVLVTQVIGLDI